MSFPRVKISRNVIIVVVVFSIIGGGLVFGQFERKKKETVFVATTPVAPVSVGAKDVYALAHETAQRWSNDTVLSYVSSGTVEQSKGHSDTWQFIFISDIHTGKGYRITINAGKVSATEEIDYQGSGAPLPSTMISQEEAVLRVRKMPGYEHVEVLGVEAVYGPSGKVWYWGVNTSKGGVSIEAK